ncbi:MAG: hypothetical protein HGB32_12565 [Geobacteraceae bacterium]|nr:hypothetical protein [Geobacteraceae bacterium]NTW80960.1 hypothetical protein [Geobacteraceae bacterium]
MPPIDNGCGIPKSHLTRVFEPFFTTREVAREIVRAVGGNIEIKSLEGIRDHNNDKTAAMKGE